MQQQKIWSEIQWVMSHDVQIKDGFPIQQVFSIFSQ